MAESIAELEYSVRFHEHFKRLASLWLRIHIAFAIAFYVLLGLHIWASIHFGLRWFG
jgi:ABC-type transport system involved in cytochrome c biogenesis permease subunit